MGAEELEDTNMRLDDWMAGHRLMDASPKSNKAKKGDE